MRIYMYDGYTYIHRRTPITRVSTHPTVQYLIIPPVKSIFIFQDNDREKKFPSVYIYINSR